MNVGQRIKNRRKELGLSAEDVAERMGVSPATVYRYESSEIMNMRTDKLVPIANALQTTPPYLMGWTDDPNENIAPNNGLSDMLENLRRSPGRRTMFSLTKNVDEKKMDEVNRVLKALIGDDDATE